MRNRALYLALFDQEISQQKLADKSSVPQAYISETIRGRRILSPRHQQRLADALQIPVDKIFGKILTAGREK